MTTTKATKDWGEEEEDGNAAFAKSYITVRTPLKAYRGDQHGNGAEEGRNHVSVQLTQTNHCNSTENNRANADAINDANGPKQEGHHHHIKGATRSGR